MNLEEIKTSIEAYSKLESECRRIAKMYLDFTESGGTYYGHVSQVEISVVNNNFKFSYYPSTSGIGGQGVLSLDFIRNGGDGLREKVKSDYAKRIKEYEDSKCKLCGQQKNQFNPVMTYPSHNFITR